MAAPLATGVLSGLASTGIGKLFGSGMITIPISRKPNVLKDVGPYLTKRQKEKIWKGEPISLTKNQKTSGGFLPLLLGAIGNSLIPSVIGAIIGKGGLQIDSQKGHTEEYQELKKKKIIIIIIIKRDNFI